MCPSCGTPFSDGDSLCRMCSEDSRIRWESIMPPMFKGTVADRLPKPFVDAVKGYKYGPRGVLFHGETGAGKTRAAWLLAHKLHTEGRSVRACSAHSFGLQIANSFQNGGMVEFVNSFLDADVVFIDDLDKVKMTSRVQSELFGIADACMTNGKPMIVTLNATSGELAGMLDSHIGSPLIRRLVEVCHVVKSDGGKDG